jgi:hypothetical protein
MYIDTSNQEVPEIVNLGVSDFDRSGQVWSAPAGYIKRKTLYGIKNSSSSQVDPSIRASPAEALSYFSGFTLKLEHFAPKICYYIRPP